MSDRRQHRGAHPEDARNFASSTHSMLRSATFELSWLLERGYSEHAALKLVGDKHQLTSRQREAIVRAACTESAREQRIARKVGLSSLSGAELSIDGFNCLITLEVMLSRGPIFIGRDEAWRDLASVHGTYRRVAETEPAIDLLVNALAAWGVVGVRVLLDRPVANSGRLRGLFEQALARTSLRFSCELSDRVDSELVSGPASAPGTEHAQSIVASSDSWVLDHATAWTDLPRLVAERHDFPLWSVNLA